MGTHDHSMVMGTRYHGNKYFNHYQAKNVANTAAVHYGGRLLALWEGGLPHELDPAGLQATYFIIS